MMNQSANPDHPGSPGGSGQAAEVEVAAPAPKSLIVTQIRARHASCECPHCGEEVEGWAADPRGRETICDDCKQPFSIANDALVSIS